MGKRTWVRFRGSLETWMILALILGLVWRITRYAVGFPMWGDEAFVAVNFLTRGFGGMLETLDHEMVAPLGFLWTNLAVSKVLGTSEWSLRLIPWGAGIAAILLFWILARKTMGRHAALVAVSIFAASYYPVRHAAEVKHYSLDLLFAILVLWQAWRIGQDPLRKNRWWIYTLLTTTAVWFSYTSIFVAGGASLVLGIRVIKQGHPRILSVWLLNGVLLGLSFLAAYLLVGSKQQWNPATIQTGQWARHFPPLSEPLTFMLWLVRQHTGNMFAYPNGGKNYGCIVTTLLVILGSVALYRRGRRSLVILLLSSLPLMFLASLMYKYPYGGSARTNLHLAAPVCLLAGAGAVALLRCIFTGRRVAAGVRVVVMLMLLVAAVGAVRDTFQPYKKISDRDNRAMVHWLEDQWSPGDYWAVFGRFEDCEHAPNLLRWGGSAARMRYYLLCHSPGPILWAPKAETLDPEAPGRLWLVVYRDNNMAFPEALWKDYRMALKERLGIPETRTFDFGPGKERVELLKFSSSGH